LSEEIVRISKRISRSLGEWDEVEEISADLVGIPLLFLFSKTFF